MKNADVEPKYKVVEEKGWIPLSDGTKLAATFYRPKSEEKFPAILTYLPYRKDDCMVPGDKRMYHYFAQRGYVGVRVDVRGTGSSEGFAENEYVIQEQLDGYDVIEWLAAQEWCSGKVGMQGISYGGFSTVLVASQDPPHLAAISPWYFTDDGFTDGDHFEGGCRTAMGLGNYGLRMLARNALPPDPEYFEKDRGKWEELWHKRLEEYVPWILEWFDHHTNDEFWQVQSLRPDYAAIKCPVFMIGGWGDRFRNAVLRMLEHLQVPNKALIGPWVHGLPDTGHPGPNIDYLHQVLRWWDYWLKGIDNGVMDEPALAVYVQRNRAPGLFTEYAEGHWRYEKDWPLKDDLEQPYYFHSNGTLTRKQPTADKETYDQYAYRPQVGIMGNLWMSQACSLGQEQSLDEAFSLTFTTEPLQEDLEILGFPQVQLSAASTAENTAFVVKLTEVNPLGESNLVTYGVLNAAHRDSHEDPKALEPGKIYKLNIEMSAISWIFKKDHRIRVSVSSSHWPVLWPLPDPAVNRIYLDKAHPSKLILPVIPAREHSQQPTYEVPPPRRPSPDVKAQPVGKPSLKITRDILNDEIVVELKTGRQFTLVDRDLTMTFSSTIRSHLSTKDPAISSVHSDNTEELHYASGLTIGSRGTGTISSNKKQFQIHLTVNVEVNGQRYFEKSWLKSVPRDFV